HRRRFCDQLTRQPPACSKTWAPPPELRADEAADTIGAGWPTAHSRPRGWHPICSMALCCNASRMSGTATPHRAGQFVLDRIVVQMDDPQTGPEHLRPSVDPVVVVLRRRHTDCRNTLGQRENRI